MNEDVSIETKPVTGFLRYYQNEKTRTNYRNAIRIFLTELYPHTQNDETALDTTAAAYLLEVRNLRSPAFDVQNVGIILSQKYAPTTVNLNINLILTWLEDNNITIKKRERQRIFAKLPPVYSIREEAELTRTLFQEIYNALPQWPRVLLLVLLASGMRIGEALALKITDIDWTGERTMMNIRRETTKTKMPRRTYLTAEASKALSEYLKMRTDNDVRVFPHDRASAQYYMRKAADKTGHTKTQNKPRDIHWHMTRKWFISRFSLYASKEVAEELAGHEGYLSHAYQRFTKKQILHQYEIAEKHLTLFLETDDE